ncbi:MAG: gamma-glutamyl-phosphate reductase, partial [Gammaproteobacteria bacterium]
MRGVGQRAREAAHLLGCAETAAKNAALLGIAEALVAERPRLETENHKDLRAGGQRGLEAALLDRLALTQARIDAMAEGLRQVAALPDPVGAITGLDYRPSGIQ